MGFSHSLVLYQKSHSFAALTRSISDTSPTRVKMPYAHAFHEVISIGTAAHWHPQQQDRLPVPVTASLWELQGQAEPVHHAASTSSTSKTDHSTGSKRILHPPEAVDTFSRFAQN